MLQTMMESRGSSMAHYEKLVSEHEEKGNQEKGEKRFCKFDCQSVPDACAIF